MAMTKLIEEVKELIEKEYGRMGAQYGLTYHTDHEAYAVLLEEIQEAKADVESFDRHMAMFWQFVKSDDEDHFKYASLLRMHERALLGACELIQVAAVVKKAALTVCDRGAINELKEGGWSE